MQNYLFADVNSTENFCLDLVSITDLDGGLAGPAVVDNEDTPAFSLAESRGAGYLQEVRVFSGQDTGLPPDTRLRVRLVESWLPPSTLHAAPCGPSIIPFRPQ